MAIEGSLRNPNVSDLVIGFWDERIDDNDIGLKFFQDTEAISRQEVGLGCGSHTMIMPDTRISLFSAVMAERARQIIESETLDDGELLIGLLDDNELYVEWKRIYLEKTTVINLKGENKWEIRLLGKAINQIMKEANEWDKIETGGVLIGKISIVRRCCTISRVLEAPPDSTRSENQFILGIEGLRKKVLELHVRSGNTLTYVGTWHSHPRGGESSSVDKASLQKINKLRFGFPTIGLIWTSQGFNAVVDEGNF